jgi:hypothetical protein
VRILKHLSLGLLLLCPALGPSQEKAKSDPMKPADQLTGVWRGAYQYPQGGGQAPVNFELVLIQDGSDVGGFIKEPNTFGSRKEPFLAAAAKGRFDRAAGKLTFTKTYDGTAGPNHDVEYTGTLSKDGMKLEGTWDIGGFSGTFALEKVKDTRSGPFAGVWFGTYHHPPEKGLQPTKFQMILVHQGDGVMGFIKETNDIAANKDEPYLHSSFKGGYDGKTGKLTFTKTYDGTAGEKRTVQCAGKVSFDMTLAEGLWTVPNGGAGRLSLTRQRLDSKTLAGLK